MSIFSSGAKVVSKLLTPAEKAASDFVKRKSNIIPSETKSGQTGLFGPSDYKGSRSSGFIPDPRKPGLSRIQDDLEFLRTNKPVVRPAPKYKVPGMTVTQAAKDSAASDARRAGMRERVKGLARNEELSMKSKVAAKRRKARGN